MMNDCHQCWQSFGVAIEGELPLHVSHMHISLALYFFFFGIFVANRGIRNHQLTAAAAVHHSRPMPHTRMLTIVK